jgi:hypothetical protein
MLFLDVIENRIIALMTAIKDTDILKSDIWDNSKFRMRVSKSVLCV